MGIDDEKRAENWVLVCGIVGWIGGLSFCLGFGGFLIGLGSFCLASLAMRRWRKNGSCDQDDFGAWVS